MSLHKNNKKTIAFVFPSMRIGGVELKILHLTKYLKNNFNIFLISLEKAADLHDEFRGLGVNVIFLNKDKKYDVLLVYKLNIILKKIKPQIVHTFLGGNYWGRFSAILSGVPHIIGNEDSLRYWQRLIDKYIFKVLYLFTDVIVCNSSAIKRLTKQLTKTDDSKYLILPNGFSIKREISFENIINIRYQQKPKSQVRLLSVGRLEWRKGYLEILKVIKCIVDSGTTNFIYYIVGDGPDAQLLREYIISNGLEKYIVLKGALKDTENIYLNSDLFLHAPREEGFGIVLLEAMYFCLPIITTNVGGIPEIVPKNTNQISLVNHMNSTDVYKEISNYIINYNIDINDIYNNRIHAEKYLWKNISCIYKKLYKRLLNNNKYVGIN